MVVSNNGIFYQLISEKKVLGEICIKVRENAFFLTFENHSYHILNRLMPSQFMSIHIHIFQKPHDRAFGREV